MFRNKKKELKKIESSTAKQKNDKNKIELEKYKAFTPIINKESFKNEVALIKYYIDDKKVKNLGIIGPHSSGKSSIINTFLSENEKVHTIISLGEYRNNVEQEETLKGEDEDVNKVERITIENKIIKSLVLGHVDSKLNGFFQYLLLY